MKSLLCSLFLVVCHAAFAQECFLEVRTGGGITGAATVYQVHPHGKVLKGQGLGSIQYDQMSMLKKSRAKKFYRKTRKLLTLSPSYNFPGNVYYSLAVQENDKQTKITWGDAQHSVPEKAKRLYQQITDALSQLTFTAHNTP
jgi:hypothetical protein